METPEIIISRAIAQSYNSSIHEELNSILLKLESKTLEEFLNGEKSEEIRSIDNEIRNIVTSNVHTFRNESEDKIAIVAQIIFTVKEYLQKGISNGDVRAVLIFLGVNCYLQIEIEKLLSEDELEETNTQIVSEKIIKILKSINLTTQVLPDAPYHEKEMMKEYSEGFSENNIAKTYKLIEAIERGGRGFHFNFLLENLLSFLYKINFTCFVNVLSSLKSPNEFVFYLQSLKKEELLKIANESTISNKWLNFEIIRQIIEKENKESYEELEIESIKAVIGRIENVDFGFLKQTIKYFHRSKLFNASLGTFLVSIEESKIEEIISKCFTIDKYSFNLEARDVLREQFIKLASIDQFDFFHTLVFNKWKLYFDIIHSTEDFYQNGLLITDFANFVVYYHTNLTDDNTLILMIDELIEKVRFIDSEWTCSSSQQITKFHLYHSELFLLTYAYRNKKLNVPQLLGKYEELINNRIHLSRYVSEETSNFLNQGRQNIDWINEYAV
jgi:hypothetical protein